MINIKFECPECGSSHFGTQYPFDTKIRDCHDEFNVDCKWSGFYDFKEKEKEVIAHLINIGIDYMLSLEDILDIKSRLSKLPLR
jgi:hypothetical protein